MTQETLQRALQISNTISNLDTQIKIVEDMHHCGNGLVLEVDTIGAITIAWDDELKDDIIDMVLRHLNNKKENLEDELRLL